MFPRSQPIIKRVFWKWSIISSDIYGILM